VNERRAREIARALLWLTVFALLLLGAVPVLVQLTQARILL
jgi:predicted nucleic acid-binding Zn ribbon protein